MSSSAARKRFETELGKEFAKLENKGWFNAVFLTEYNDTMPFLSVSAGKKMVKRWKVPLDAQFTGWSDSVLHLDAKDGSVEIALGRGQEPDFDGLIAIMKYGVEG